MYYIITAAFYHIIRSSYATYSCLHNYGWYKEIVWVSVSKTLAWEGQTGLSTQITVPKDIIRHGAV